MLNMNFEAYPKIPRLRRDCVITEKIDGTNAQIVVPDNDSEPLLAGSRNRWITPEDDNFGFARWVKENEARLRAVLGPGQHFGEWWGQGIQKRYAGLTGRKMFSLFNTHRWNVSNLPEYLSVVPVLYQGPFSDLAIDAVLEELRVNGSRACPGCAKPEGVVVFHTAAQAVFKVTLEGDEAPKGKP
jgi:RNA ligase